MIYQLAPLEGITGYVYRNAYAKYYGNVDEYFTPFISPHKDKTLNSKELKDIDPQNNQNINLIPQILSNSSVDCIKTINVLKDFGYSHVNLNFGCPSATVTTKKKGSGILTDLELLKYFLDELFSNSDIEISVKTRIGFDSPSEWEEIFSIYKLYNLKELIVHPRIRQDFYNNVPDLNVFNDIYNDYHGQLVYNGNLFTSNQIKEITGSYPNLYGIMMGRGFIANPNLLCEHLAGKKNSIKVFRSFHDEIFEGYKATIDGDRNVLFRMKELWFYWAKSFDSMPKLEKQLKKAQKCQEYEIIVNQIFNNIPMVYDNNSNIDI